MAEVYSAQYTNEYRTSPRVKTRALRGPYVKYWTFTAAGTVTAATDSIVMGKLPGSAVVWVPGIYLCAAVTGSTTWDLGWDAYTEYDGDAVVADPNGLLAVVDTDTNGIWHAGMVAVATPDDLLPPLFVKEFRAKEEVTIRLTPQAVNLSLNDVIHLFLPYYQAAS